MLDRAGITGDGVSDLIMGISRHVVRLSWVCVLLSAWMGLSSASAQDSSGLQFGAQVAQKAGLSFYDPGEWGVSIQVVENHSNQTVEALALLSYQDAPLTKFGSMISLPPQSRRRVYTPVSPFGLPAVDSGRAPEVRADLLAGDNFTTTAATAYNVLPDFAPGLRSAAAFPTDDDGPRQIHNAMRQAAGLTKTTFTVSPTLAPEDAYAWSGLDTFTIASDDRFSIAQINAIRHWLYNGGRLWIMLDQTGQDLPRQLLGQDWRISEIKRTALNRIRAVNPAQRDHNGDPKLLLDIESEYPVYLSRVWVDDADVLVEHRLEGEASADPLAVKWTVGRGVVLVTTVASPAWVGSGADEQTQANEAMRRVSRLFLAQARPNNEPPTMATASAQGDALAPVIRSQVGHGVLSRGLVATLLGVFILGLIAMCIVLGWQRRQEWASLLGIVFATVIAAVVVVLGGRTLKQTPSVVAATAISQSLPYRDIVSTTGSISLYRRPGSPRINRMTYTGPPPVLSEAITDGGVWIVREDRNRWALHQVDLAPGEAHRYRLAGPVDRDPQPLFWVSLDEQQLTIQAVQEQRVTMEAPILATSSGSLALTTTQDGVYRADIEELTDTDAGSALLSQREIEQQAVYSSILDGPDRRPGITLMGWQDQSPFATDFSDNIEARNDSLYVYPVAFAPVAPGKTARIPAPLFSMAPFSDSDLKIAGSIWDPKAKEWLTGINMGQTAGLHFTPPPPLDQLEPIALRVTMDLNAPGRTYEVLTIVNGSLVSLHQGNDPRGKVTFSVDDPARLARAEEGGIYLVLKVANPNLDGEIKGWTLSSFDVDMTGRAPE